MRPTVNQPVLTATEKRSLSLGLWSVLSWSILYGEVHEREKHIQHMARHVLRVYHVRPVRVPVWE